MSSPADTRPPTNWDGSLIRAAGGILERREQSVLKIALIRRQRYGVEWALPKGKVEPGEPVTVAALREVKEETGCSAVITGFSGTTTYFVEQIPKIVFFWFMREAGPSKFVPNDEVLELDWTTPSAAMQRLSHADERELIAISYPREVGMDGKMGRWRELWFGISRMFIRTRWRRVEGNIAAYEIELRQRRAPADSRWFESALSLLGLAKLALRENNVDKGWKCLAAAQRMEIFGLDPDKELQTKAATIRAEVDKLNEWRKKAVRRLLGTEDHPRAATAEDVYQAALIRDEHFQNLAYKDGLARNQSLRLLLFLVLSIATILTLVWRDALPFDVGASASPGEETVSSQVRFWTLVAVSLFGFTGAVFSAVLAVPDPTKSSRIPEIVTGLRLTLLRLVMGVVSALVVFLLIQSQFGNVLALKIEGEISAFTLYALAFFAGFTERLVLKAVGLLTK